MYKFDKSNIDLLEALLYDADFPIKDIPEKVENDMTRFNLRRPYWENQIKTKCFWIRKTVVKEVFSQLVFDGLIEIKIIWKDDIFNEPHHIHSIMHVEYRKDEKVFWLDMAFFELEFYLKPDFEISLIDLGEPTKSNFLNIIGWKGMQFNEWKKDYGNSREDAS